MPHAAAAQPQRSNSATERETTGGPTVDGVFLRIYHRRVFDGDAINRLRTIFAKTGAFRALRLSNQAAELANFGPTHWD
jgi:hypothetical protein